MPAPPRRPGSGLRVERLEDRTVPSFSPFQNPGGLSIAVGDVFPEVGPGATANEIIVGAGPGELPFVRVFDLAGNLEAEFLAYEPSFRGGVNVAVGNVVVDPLATQSDFREIVTGPGFGGGPIVKVFNPNNRTAVQQYLAFEPSFRGGVNVAAGNVNTASTSDEVIVGAGFGGGPVVRVFNAAGTAFSAFFAYESSFRNGVNVAVGDAIGPAAGATFSGDEIVTGPGEGGAPLLKVFGGTGTLFRSFFAFDFQSRNGLTVTVGDTERSLGAEVFAVEQFTPLTTAPRVRSFNAQDAGQIESDFTPFPAGYTRYVNMATGDVDPFFTISVLGVTNNAPDWVGVAGEGPTAQQPRVEFGLVGSAAGNNGP